MDVATLVSKETNGLSYPTPSSASTAVRPTLSLPAQIMSEPTPTTTMVNGRIYRYVKDALASDEWAPDEATVWILFSSLSGLACVDSETRSVGAIGAARSQMLGPKTSDASKQSWLIRGLVQDRRPITPPPCIRLVVKDANTNKELDIKSVLSHSLVNPWLDWANARQCNAGTRLKFHGVQ